MKTRIPRIRTSGIAPLLFFVVLSSIIWNPGFATADVRPESGPPEKKIGLWLGPADMSGLSATIGKGLMTLETNGRVFIRTEAVRKSFSCGTTDLTRVHVLCSRLGLRGLLTVCADAKTGTVDIALYDASNGSSTPGGPVAWTNDARILTERIVSVCALLLDLMPAPPPGITVTNRMIMSLAIPPVEPAKLSDVARKKTGAGRGEDRDFPKPGFAAESKTRTVGGRPAVQGPSGLKAGYSDDNRQFNYFVNFLAKYSNQVPHYNASIDERIALRILDSSGKSVPNASVEIRAADDGIKRVASGLSFADGTFLFFPSDTGSAASRFNVTVTAGPLKKEFSVDRQGKRQADLALDAARPEPKAVMDIVFVLDTTGSMGEEIDRLKKTIEIIHLNLTGMPSRPAVRFGLVLYRDRGDEYVTRVVQPTPDLQVFRKELGKVFADGGGDTPEDLQAALDDCVNKIDWNKNGVRLAFLVTDAAPHLDYAETYTYIDAMRAAKASGIKLFTVGTGGLPIDGEYVLRQVSQYTYAKYIFLTYGEKGESEGGSEGSVSHHTGANFTTDKLESVVIRFAKDELAAFMARPPEAAEDYFEARPLKDEKKDETLKKLFDQSVNQLLDFSSWRIPAGTAASVLPLSVTDPGWKPEAEYFTERLSLAVRGSPVLKPVERGNLQEILKELALSLEGLTQDDSAAKVGRLLGAKLLVTGSLFKSEKGFEAFLKLISVETGEILAMTRLKIDPALGL